MGDPELGQMGEGIGWRGMCMGSWRPMGSKQAGRLGEGDVHTESFLRASVYLSVT